MDKDLYVLVTNGEFDRAMRDGHDLTILHYASEVFGRAITDFLRSGAAPEQDLHMAVQAVIWTLCVTRLQMPEYKKD